MPLCLYAPIPLCPYALCCPYAAPKPLCCPYAPMLSPCCPLVRSPCCHHAVPLCVPRPASVTIPPGCNTRHSHDADPHPRSDTPRCSRYTPTSLQAAAAPKVDLIINAFTLTGVALMCGEAHAIPVAGFCLQPTCIPSDDDDWRALTRTRTRTRTRTLTPALTPDPACNRVRPGGEPSPCRRK